MGIKRFFTASLIMIIVIFCCSIKLSALAEDGEYVTLQLQLILHDNGVPINAEKDITVRIGYEALVGNVIVWEQDQSNILIANGVANLTISGESTGYGPLVPDIFDNNGLYVEVEIDADIVTLDLVSQPYTIKARISDYSHSTKGINNIPVQEVDVLTDGDILKYQDGKWVPMSIGDTETGIEIERIDLTNLEGLENITINALNKNDIIVYDGELWRNSQFPTIFNEDDIVQIIINNDFLQSIAITDIPGGKYPQITGIGDEISIDASVNLNKNTFISDDLYVSGLIGATSAPINEIYSEKFNFSRSCSYKKKINKTLQ